MLFSLAFSGCLLIACAYDLRDFRIPNAIPLAVVALFLIKAATNAEGGVWPTHLSAFAITLGLGFVAFAFGIFGGGDAKLMSAVALWLGMAALPDFLTLTAIGGGLFAITLMALRYVAERRQMVAPSDRRMRSPRVLERNAPVPYALPIAFAATLLVWQQV